jgi:hypothetical protein
MLFEDDSQGGQLTGSRKPDFSAKLGEEFLNKLSVVCQETKESKTEFFKRKIQESWMKLSFENLFDKNPE